MHIPDLYFCRDLYSGIENIKDEVTKSRESHSYEFTALNNVTGGEIVILKVGVWLQVTLLEYL